MEKANENITAVYTQENSQEHKSMVKKSVEKLNNALKLIKTQTSPSTTLIETFRDSFNSSCLMAISVHQTAKLLLTKYIQSEISSIISSMEAVFNKIQSVSNFFCSSLIFRFLFFISSLKQINDTKKGL